MLFESTNRHFLGRLHVQMHDQETRDLLTEIDFIPEDVVTLEDDLLQITARGRIKADLVRVWWPNGQGEQPLYDVTATLSGPDAVVSEKTIQVGWVAKKECLHFFKSPSQYFSRLASGLLSSWSRGYGISSVATSRPTEPLSFFVSTLPWCS